VAAVGRARRLEHVWWQDFGPDRPEKEAVVEQDGVGRAPCALVAAAAVDPPLDRVVAHEGCASRRRALHVAGAGCGLAVLVHFTGRECHGENLALWAACEGATVACVAEHANERTSKNDSSVCNNERVTQED
jgi:hypothetical protein